MQYKPFHGDFSVEGKVALITGSAHSIGLAAAKIFAKKGAKVIMWDILDEVHARAAEIQAETHSQVIAETCDITKKEEVDRCLAKALSSLNRVDILCNIAGCCVLEKAESITMEQWDKQFSVNAKGTFLVTQAVGRSMMANGGGKVVSVASQAAFIAVDSHLAYTASKAAIIGMTKVLALEWAPYNINVNVVSPTVVLSELNEGYWGGEPGEALSQKIPAGRLARPDDVAASLLFLCSSGSDMITGEHLVMDGGYTIQ